MSEKGNPPITVNGLQTGRAALQITVEYPQDTKNKSITGQEILLGICLRNSTSYSTESCSATVIATLFIIARKWQHSKCPSTDEWTMNCSTYTL